MGLGIKEPRTRREEVTGTIRMLHHLSEDVEIDPNDTANDVSTTAKDGPLYSTSTQDTGTTLKTTKDGVILNPQPQDNPNDPLNMPLWRRDMALLVIGFHSFIGGGQTPILAAGLTSIATEFHKSATTISYLVGGFMLSLGFGSLFASPSAVLYGKRIIYLGGCLVAFAGSIWGAKLNSFGSLMGSRVLIAFGMSPTESLPSATIAEIYFAHERAYRLGIYTFLLLGGKNLVPLLTGFVFQSLDRHWLFWILAIILGINFGLMFFFAPETFWDRLPTPNKRSQQETLAAREYKLTHTQSRASIRSHPNSFARRDSLVESLNSSVLNATAEDVQVSEFQPRLIESEGNPLASSRLDSVEITRKPYKKTLKVTSGRHTVDKWWMVFLRPLVLYTYPSVLFGAILYAFAIVWLILISESISHIFTKEPYNFRLVIIGLFYVSPFVGGSLGSVVVGKLSDILVRKLVEKNKGVYEPEFRLVMVLPVFITVSIGLMGFGWSVENKDLWIVPVVFFGILGFGCSLASTTLITFTVDSYKVFATEALVTLNFTKNTLGFIFSLFNNAFIDARGPKIAFITYGVVQIFICFFAIPLYFYGKRLRAWTDDNEIIKFLYVSEDEDEDEEEEEEESQNEKESNKNQGSSENILDEVQDKDVPLETLKSGSKDISAGTETK